MKNLTRNNRRGSITMGGVDKSCIVMLKRAERQPLLSLVPPLKEVQRLVAQNRATSWIDTVSAVVCFDTH